MAQTDATAVARLAVGAEAFREIQRLAGEEADGWVLAKRSEEHCVYTMKTSESSVQRLKIATGPASPFAHVPASVVWDVLLDPEFRPVWDPQLREMRMVERLAPNAEVSYYACKMPVIGVYPRDWCNACAWTYDSAAREYVYVNRSVQHPLCPERRGFVRAHSSLTGYVVRPTPDNAGCSVVYTTHNEMRGWLPKWALSFITRKLIPHVATVLLKACQEYPAWKAQHNPTRKPWLVGAATEVVSSLPAAGSQSNPAL